MRFIIQITEDGMTRSTDISLDQPYRHPELDAWACDIVFGNERRPIFGATPLQAVELAAKVAPAFLRGSSRETEVTCDGLPFVLPLDPAG